MSINDILESRYNQGDWDYSSLTKEELDVFVKEYLEVSRLHEEYHKGDCNRKELGEEISKRAVYLMNFANFFKSTLYDLERINDCPDTIDDCNKVFELLLHLVNIIGDKEYSIKSFKAMTMGSVVKDDETTESGLLEEEIRVLGKKSILDAISNEKAYYDPAFREIISEVINKGHSIVMITNHRNEYNIYPRFVNSCNKMDFDIIGLPGSLHSYTHSDELEYAVLLLDKYIKCYGGILENLSIETLLSRISDLTVKDHSMKLDNGKMQFNYSHGNHDYESLETKRTK